MHTGAAKTRISESKVLRQEQDKRERMSAAQRRHRIGIKAQAACGVEQARTEQP